MTRSGTVKFVTVGAVNRSPGGDRPMSAWRSRLWRVRTLAMKSIAGGGQTRNGFTTPRPTDDPRDRGKRGPTSSSFPARARTPEV